LWGGNGRIEILPAVRVKRAIPGSVGASLRRLRIRIPITCEILSGLRHEGGRMNAAIAYALKPSRAMLDWSK
jgi:hypothetical protein